MDFDNNYQSKGNGAGFAVASMVLGIIALSLMIIPPFAMFVSPMLAIIGIVFASLARRGGHKSSKATAGLVCSIISLALMLSCVACIACGVYFDRHFV